MSRWWNSRRFDFIEVSCLVLLAGFLVWNTGHTTLLRALLTANHEAEPFAAKYGPEKYSENEEEWIIRDFFKDRRDGFFVDIGANHYMTFSNTYYLEAELGWSGIAVDPQERFEADYRKHRPRTRFFALFVSDMSEENANMYVLDRTPLVTSGTRGFTERWGKGAKEVTVPTITLDDLLDRLQVKGIDLLSIDVELAEPKVLAGFDIGKTKPAFVCIEAHPEVRQQILDYFVEHRYVVVGRYLRADNYNLYFAPLSRGSQQ
jgi:FkbM family methyltransferase